MKAISHKCQSNDSFMRVMSRWSFKGEEGSGSVSFFILPVRKGNLLREKFKEFQKWGDLQSWKQLNDEMIHLKILISMGEMPYQSDCPSTQQLPGQKAWSIVILGNIKPFYSPLWLCFKLMLIISLTCFPYFLFLCSMWFFARGSPLVFILSLCSSVPHIKIITVV